MFTTRSPEWTGENASSGHRLWLRIALLVGLAVLQALFVSLVHEPPRGVADGPELPATFGYAGLALRAVLLFLAIYAVLNWHRRDDLASMWRTALATHRPAPWLLANAVLFAAALGATAWISSDPVAYVRWMNPYLALIGMVGLTIVLAAAPMPFWRDLVLATWKTILLAILATAFAMGVSALSQAGWSPLAGATLYLSALLLGLYEDNVIVDMAQRDLGVGSFVVNIAPACSGYEGVGLVTVVVSIYLYVFRRTLAFPNALFLLPIGILAIWLFNVVRIAALVSIGAHVSEPMAIGGFHSQAGWLAFLMVTAGVMVMGSSLSLFRKQPDAATATLISAPTASPQGAAQDDDALPWLAPFMALLTASIVAALFQPHDQWLYGLRVAFIVAALYAFRATLRPLVAAVDPWSIVAGLVVGAAWIATDPDPASGAELGAWLAALPLWAATLWLALRVVGTVVLVPIAEELAFRGFLIRSIATSRPFGAGPVTMIVVAFVTSSLLFGLLHQRWLAAMLAGAVYALVMFRTGRMSDPVAAHMASNAIIVAWAIAVAQWSLI